MSFQIKTDVPLPGARNSYPFEDMAPGPCFEIVGDNEARKVRNAAYQYAKKMNLAAAVRETEAALGQKLTADEKEQVTPVAKGHAEYVAFAQRKLRVVDDKGHTRTESPKEGKFADGSAAHGVHGLWRTE